MVPFAADQDLANRMRMGISNCQTKNLVKGMEIRKFRNQASYWSLRTSQKSLRVMKVIVLLLLVGTLQVSATSVAQTVKLHVKNEQLIKVLGMIERQARVYFLYNQKDLDQVRVTANLENVKIEMALSKILEGHPLTFIIEGRNIAIERKKQVTVGTEIQSSFPDSLINIQGTVLNSQNVAIAGASVSVKGTNIGASTATDGSFILQGVKKNAILLISSVGYETKLVKVTGESPISIQLTISAQSMEEITIVNTGYQKLPKERSTGSYAFVDSALFNRTVSTNIIDRLDGIVPGVLFDRRNPSETFIQIRGLYTLTETISSPLIVLDNFPYAGDINNINPNDVENITILKDAASTSIWGAKAGNGVIVITTKRGKINQPFRMNLRANLTFISNPDIMGLPQMSTSDFIDVESMLFNNGAYDGMISQPEFYSVTPVVEILNQLRKNEIDEPTASARINALRSLDLRKDFKKYAYRTGINQQYALNFSGGSNSITYYISSGLDKNLSFNRGDQFKRINLNTSVTFNPIKKLQLSLSNYLTKSDAKSNGLRNYSGLQINGNKKIYPYAQIADAEGNPLPIANNYGSVYTDTVGNGLLLDWKYRPLQDARNSDNNLNTLDLISNLTAKYEIFPFLSAELSYRYEKQITESENYYSKETYSTRDLINLFTQINGSGIKKIVPDGGILETRKNDISNHAIRGILNFSKTFNQHSISGLLGGELRQTEVFSDGHRTYGFDKSILSGADVDVINYYQLINGGYGRVPSTNTGMSRLTDKLVSVFGNAAYVYDNRYTFTISARRDASNLFGVSARNKWKPLWSSGMAWNISNESFYNSKLIPYLNLRVSYGFSGNVNNSMAGITTLSRQPAFFQITNIPFAQIKDIPNPNLGWEKVKTVNVGIDFALRNRLIYGSIEYYSKKSTDVIANTLLDPTSGVPSLKVNSAHMAGNGVDFQLNTRAIITKQINWMFTLNLSYANYKVTRYLLPKPKNPYSSSGSSVWAIEGLNPFEVVSFQWGGLNPSNGNPRGILNGKVTDNLDSVLNNSTFDDQIKHGSALPKVFGNLLNTFSIYGFNISANIIYKFGYYFRRPSIHYASLFANNFGHSDFAKRWQKPGDENSTNVPSMIYPDPTNGRRDDFYANSAVNVDKGDHVKLQDIRVGYSLNHNTIRRLPFSSVQIFINATDLNILLWKKNKWNINPDFAGYIMRPGKSISVGTNISF